MDFQEHETYSLYAALWHEAQPAIARNEIVLDAHLSDREHDTRRGITVVARIPKETTLSISRFVDALKRMEPHQYYTRPDEYHVTVLSLFTATEEYLPYFSRQEEYRQAVRDALKEAREFTLAFAGVTASKGVIMVQGFPQDDALNAVREKLRNALRRAGLGAALDTRYRVHAAHISVARFMVPLLAPQQTSEMLQESREINFGSFRVQRLETVANDWYMSHDRVTLLDTHTLS